MPEIGEAMGLLSYQRRFDNPKGYDLRGQPLDPDERVAGFALALDDERVMA
jgi:hypothetical protein